MDRMENMPNRNMNDAYTLRLPDGWRDAIKAEASKNRRSMNSEIIEAIAAAMRMKGVQLAAVS